MPVELRPEQERAALGRQLSPLQLWCQSRYPCLGFLICKMNLMQFLPVGFWRGLSETRGLTHSPQSAWQ